MINDLQGFMPDLLNCINQIFVIILNDQMAQFLSETE
jgi:hypothetical protein